jgi:hypothetical protein
MVLSISVYGGSVNKMLAFITEQTYRPKYWGEILFAFARIPWSLSERRVDPAVGATGMNGEATAP